MNRKHKLFMVLVVLLLLLAVSFPFGMKILSEEGFEGVWRRKRTNFEKVAPSSAPALDRVEDVGRSALGE